MTLFAAQASAERTTGVPCDGRKRRSSTRSVRVCWHRVRCTKTTKPKTRKGGQQPRGWGIITLLHWFSREVVYRSDTCAIYRQHQCIISSFFTWYIDVCRYRLWKRFSDHFHGLCVSRVQVVTASLVRLFLPISNSRRIIYFYVLLAMLAWCWGRQPIFCQCLTNIDTSLWYRYITILNLPIYYIPIASTDTRS